MDPRIRPARPGDLAALAEFTRDTFAWGDYVPDSFLGWLEEDNGRVMVATGEDDVPIALARVVMLSPREAWLHAARVHPGHRRSGLGMLLNRAGCTWARERGAVVVRLMVEDWNEPARRQVAKLGYRPVSRWVSASREVVAELVPRRNGGRRAPGEERLVPARSAEAEPAWIAWSTGELAVAGRQLFPDGWQFRRMVPADLTEAARSAAMWQCPSGWAIAELDEGELWVPFLAVNDLDAPRLVGAVVDLAEALHADHIRVMAPRVEWLTRVLQRHGFSLEPSIVFALSLDP